MRMTVKEAMELFQNMPKDTLLDVTLVPAVSKQTSWPEYKEVPQPQPYFPWYDERNKFWLQNPYKVTC